MSAQFTALSEADFEAHARATFQKADGSFGLTFDPKLVKSLDRCASTSLCRRPGRSSSVADIPLLVMRGANSDVLSPATLIEMARRHKNCATYIAEGQGHAPLLYDRASIGRIAEFVANVDTEQGSRRSGVNPLLLERRAPCYRGMPPPLSRRAGAGGIAVQEAARGDVAEWLKAAVC